MPSGARFDEAVVCDGAWYADVYLKEFSLKPGHRILIYGASGARATTPFGSMRPFLSRRKTHGPPAL